MGLLNGFNLTLRLAELEIGKHLYWEIGNLKLHGQVFLTSWFVIALLIVVAFLSSRNLQRIPSGLQNLMEYALEFIRDLAKTQIGEKDYRPWVPFVGTLFLFIFVSNWSGALVPWRLFELPEGELPSRANWRHQHYDRSCLADLAGIFLCWLQ